MKLLYATSITLPSRHANRWQTLSMASEFHSLLGNNFLLGIGANESDIHINVPTKELGKDKYSFLLSWKYVQMIRKERISHVYTREERIFFFLKLYAALLHLPIKIFFEAHTLNTDFFLKYAVTHADGVVALTQRLTDDIVSLGSLRRIMVAHDGVDIKKFASSISKEKARQEFGVPLDAKVVGYVGRYSTLGQDNKGVGDLIVAFGLAHRNTPLHLLLVGLAPSEVQDIESICDRAGISRGARTLVTYSPQDAVARAMHASDVLVMNYPNLPHFSRYMSPMKLFEYMASGVPIITTDLPSVREVLDDREAFFVPPGDTAVLADTIVRVTQSSGEGAGKAAAALQKIKNYTWTTRAQHILDFVQSV